VTKFVPTENPSHWRVVLLHGRKISAHLEVRPPKRKNSSAHKDVCPPINSRYPIQQLFNSVGVPEAA
ncbi:MAG: hypothetical protein ACK40X_15040, partial [Armatimonadota bacterium]